MSLQDNYKKAGELYKIHSRIIELSEANNYYITLVLKDNFRQSGMVMNINFSASFNIGQINGSVTLAVDSKNIVFNYSEIVDVF